jgi:hypothetical protein
VVPVGDLDRIGPQARTRADTPKGSQITRSVPEPNFMIAGKLRRCTDKDGDIIDFYLHLAAAFVTVRQLIQRVALPPGHPAHHPPTQMIIPIAGRSYVRYAAACRRLTSMPVKDEGQRRRQNQDLIASLWVCSKLPCVVDTQGTSYDSHRRRVPPRKRSRAVLRV